MPDAPATSPTDRPFPAARAWKRRWRLDPAIAFLNHGSYGACPAPVLRAQERWRDAIERRPIEMLDRRRPGLLRHARERVAEFVGADPEGLGFVTNATAGVNAVLRSLEFQPGDEIVITDHGYPAVERTVRHVAARTGARAITVTLPLPAGFGDELARAVEAAWTDRTRLVLVDHVTSPTAIVMPVEAIARRARARGIEVLVDGAHAPGMLDLDVRRIGATYYTANLHKWVCAPKGSGFLWVAPERRGDVHPPVISLFQGEGFEKEFEWQGTRDITAWLSVPEAIDFFAEFGWERVRRHNHERAVEVQRMLCDAWGVEPITPRDGSLLGSMAAVPTPEGVRRRFESRPALLRTLYDDFGIEIPPTEVGDRWLLRASCQVYNEPSEYERLAHAVHTLAE